MPRAARLIDEAAGGFAPIADFSDIAHDFKLFSFKL